MRVGLAGWTLSLVMAGVACSGSGAPEQAATTGTAPEAAPAATVAAGAEPRTVADLFPEGPAKAMVLNNCSTCHAVACSVIGQRSAERWDALREGHKERVADVDLETVFAYLKGNFDDSKPEPKVPPAFLEGGCTPF